MSAYHLRARLIVGPLRSPTRDEARDVESDDRSELARLATTLRSEGFTVWIFRHGVAPVPGASDLTVDERLDPLPPAPADARPRRPGRRLRIVASAPAGYRCGLTPWEIDVLVLLMRGRTNREIAVELGVDPEVVGLGVQSLLSGLGARDRVQAAVLLLRGVA